jgi:hypothetical protein
MQVLIYSIPPKLSSEIEIPYAQSEKRSKAPDTVDFLKKEWAILFK